MSDWPVLSILIFLPLVGGLGLLALPARARLLAPRLALAVSFLALVVVGWLWYAFDSGITAPQFPEQHAWISTPRVDYCLGLDGLGLAMVALAALLVPTAILASRQITERAPLYFACVLFLQAGLFGAFTALNFFHWFLCYELSLVPAFFLVRLWGGSERGPAATQFFVYTMVGSIALLLAFLALYLATGTFDWLELAGQARDQRLERSLAASIGGYGLPLSSGSLALLLALMAFLGFAVKIPVMPWHTWLPATYAEAPTGTTMLLTGVVSKLGLYGLLRWLLPIFAEPLRTVLPWLLGLAVLTIVAAAAAAFAQRDLKRLLAYSSVNHLGYCVLGVFAVLAVTEEDPRWVNEKAAALNGVVLQMFNHGVTAATLFCFVGFLEARSGGQRDLGDFGGLRRPGPVFCGLMGIALFASLGLPGLNGFVGEFLIFKGAFALAPWSAAAATLGLLITAVFLLTLMHRVFHGPLPERWAGFPDLTPGERALVLPATILFFALGLYPQLFLAVTNPTVLEIVRHL